MIGIAKIVIAGFAIIAGSAVGYFWRDYKDDNKVEEFAEELLMYETGFDIDLTPESKEELKKSQDSFEVFINQLEVERVKKRISTKQ